VPQIHDIGPKYFVHGMRYPTKDFPIIDRGQTQEIEDPYRRGDSVVVRVPLSRSAIVFGRWDVEIDEDDALRYAIKARDLDVAS
jgi:hypothetical protein